VSVLLLSLLLMTSSPHKDALVYAPIVYHHANINLGPLADEYTCYDPDDPSVVTARPLFNDEGLPLYEIFDEDTFELVGFEFRLPFQFTWQIPECDCLGFSIGFNGFSVMLQF